MKYKLQDLIDIRQFESLQEKLNIIYSLTTAILDNEGNILTAKGWQDVCTKFHRVCPESEKNCRISDSYIFSHLDKANPAVSYKCLNGLYDSAFPIIIDGTHYGNFFIGQYFLEPPDLVSFKEQAKRYGFDEESYIEAIKHAPVYTEEQLNNNLLFVKELIEIICSYGLKNLKEAQAREALNITQAMYRDLVETAQDLIWQCDAEGRYTYLNRAWEDVLGYSVEEMLGKKFTDFQTQEWAERDLKEFARLLDGNTIKGLETVHRSKNGNDINLLFNAKIVQEADGKVIGTRGTAFNISNHKAIVASLDESETKYRSLFEKISNSFALHKIVLDDNGVPVDYIFEEANLAFEKQTGLDRNLIIGKKVTEVFPGIENDPFNWIGIYGKVALTGEEIRFEQYFQHLDKWYSVLAYSNKKEHFATIFSDITERKQAEEKIKKLNEELELRVAQRTIQFDNANKELQSFVYSVSHDLRAPLRSIMGFSEIISKRYKDSLNEEGLKYFGFVLEASKNMANLIEDLLRFSRLADKPVEKELIKTSDLIDTVLKNLNHDILQNKARIVLPDKMPEIIGDRSLLGQIFTNLIQNAIMYHRKGVKPEIIISFEEGKKTTSIKILDNGQGIPQEHHAKIFNIFQRLHSNDDYPGTGIGLAIVKKAVTALGGTISVESEVNVGSSFIVTLPKN